MIAQISHFSYWFRDNSADCPCSECFSIGNWAVVMQSAVLTVCELTYLNLYHFKN